MIVESDKLEIRGHAYEVKLKVYNFSGDVEQDKFVERLMNFLEKEPICFRIEQHVTQDDLFVYHTDLTIYKTDL